MNQEPNDLKPKKTKKNVTLSVYVTSLILVAVLAVGGTYFLTEKNQNQVAVDSSNAAKVDQNFNKLQEVYSKLSTQFYKKVDSTKLLEGALSGMVNATGDPYTQYLDVAEATDLDSTISASFEGIGAEVMNQNDAITIVSPIAGSPAEKAGLLPNDVILKVDDHEMAGLTLNKAVSYIRGEKGTDVVLKIQRGTTTFDVTLKRDTIPVETVKSRLDEKDPTIGYIQITNFSQPTASEVEKAVKDLRGKGAKSFILDVRGNPGGLLDQALKISNMFVEDGKVLMQTKERDKKADIMKADATLGDFKVTEPITLLVDEGSASASEILAGALKESANTTIIGTKTFGKGTVQTVATFDDKSELKMTIAKWLTPSGQWINKKGIEPTIAIDLPTYTKLLLIDPKKTYQQNDVSDEVKNLQSVLNALGFTSNDANGYFGTGTTEAVKAFQTAHNLPSDGIVTDKTSTALIEALRELMKQNDTQYEKAVSYLQTK